MLPSHVYCRGVLVASADLEAGQPVELWAHIDDDRSRSKALFPPMDAKGPKDAKGDPAMVVLRGSSLHAYAGRRVRLGTGVATLGRAAIMSGPSGLAVRVAALAGGLPSAPPLNGVLSKRFYAQSLPSAVCAHVLAPRPGMRVLDMCAAPGGKVSGDTCEDERARAYDAFA
jgi:hypothetical protein